MIGDMEAIICSEFQPTEFIYTEIPVSTVFDDEVCFPKNEILLTTFNAHISVAFANLGWRVISLSLRSVPEARQGECYLYLYPHRVVGVCRESELSSIVSFLKGLTDVIANVGEPDFRPAYSPSLKQFCFAFEKHKREIWDFIIKVFLRPQPFVILLDAVYARAFIPFVYKDKKEYSMMRSLEYCLFENELCTLVELGKLKTYENNYTYVTVL